MHGQSLRDRRVQGFLTAEALSAIGTWATLVAIWGYAAFEFDATAGDVALFGVAFSLPPVFLGPLSGAAIDRYGPRRILAAAKALGAAASIALIAAHDFRTLAVLSALHGVAGALAVPALQSMPPRIVSGTDLARTNALVALCDQFAIVLGPVAAGAAIALFGFHGAFVFDALTYLLGLLVLPIVHVRAVVTDPSAPPSTLRDAFAGWHLVARTRTLRRAVVAMAAVHLLYGSALLAEPLYVRDVLHRSPTTFAALQTVFGVWLVVAGVVVARLEDRLATLGTVAFGVAASGLAAIVYLASPSVVVAFLGVSAWGVFTALLAGPSRTVLQRHAPEAVHGRVLAADQVSSSAAQLLGLVFAGALISANGVPPAIGLLGAFVAIVGGAVAWSHARDPLERAAVAGAAAG